jgi:hypothetical protein
MSKQIEVIELNKGDTILLVYNGLKCSHSLKEKVYRKLVNIIPSDYKVGYITLDDNADIKILRTGDSNEG